ncbi:diguanylate cyclase domain-containing protein [Pseudoalteromonas sp.]|uniref:diguanylate cyclase domain-containing protein n=1 Tax=Pseudoalteromonas sp. TaxID=53249 RepID=UPI00356AE8C5
MLRFICLYSCLLIQIIFLKVQAQPLSLDQHTQIQAPGWRHVTLAPNSIEKQLIQSYSFHDTPLTTLAAERGAAIAKIPLAAKDAGSWIVSLSVNYLDSGFAFWQDASGIKKVADFSQNHLAQTAIIMHSQAFKLTFTEPANGTLWLYLHAKHYAKPVNVTIDPENTFIHQQFLINTLSIIAITVMLTLACMALILYFKTHYSVALYCAGYIGLHGVGWACAAGLFGAFFQFKHLNSHYLGMYIFSFAIASASAFAYYLFNFQRYPTTRLGLCLKYFAMFAIICGFINLLLPFHWVFYLAHLLAAIWVLLSLQLGFTMFGLKDFRAKYFLIGNLVYSVSLIVFILSHLNILVISSPELWVLTALAIDCICILLSLSEWLKLKQHDYIQALQQSRIDPLTKAGNRLQLQENLDKLGEFYLIAFIDCDGIKSINDQLGHSHGDALLIEVTQLLKQAVGKQGEVYRTGGDEFICLFTATTATELKNLTQSVSRSLDHIHQQIIQAWPLSGVSYGLANSAECSNYSECLTLADERMYNIKHARKKTAVVSNVVPEKA